MDDHIRALEEALAVTPDNVPLRKLLARECMQASLYAKAESHFREALKREPDDAECKHGLAEAYYRQGNAKLGLVVVEDVLNGPNPPGKAFVLYARMLLKTGRVPEAVEAYRKAMALDPACEDDELRDLLGVDAGEGSGVVDGKLRASVDEIFSDIGRFERPTVTFDNVGGMDGVKEEVRVKIILPLTNQELYAQYGKAIGGGILLYGPPGCGKTFLARATAGEIRGAFMSVGLHDVLNMYIGQSERQLHDLFEQARRTSPSVLFFDEVDALAASRSDMRHSAGRHVINQFLSELDGAESSNEGVLILAATNAPWHLDSAFRRPGRFDRIIFVPPPDEAARAAILTLLLEGKPSQDVDVHTVAKKTKDYSGADLKAAIDRAVEAKLSEAMRTGKSHPLTTRDILDGVKKQRPTTKEWFATARNHALFSNEGGLYDDVLQYLGIRR